MYLQFGTKCASSVVLVLRNVMRAAEESAVEKVMRANSYGRSWSSCISLLLKVKETVVAASGLTKMKMQMQSMSSKVILLVLRYKEGVGRYLLTKSIPYSWL
jgi:hypothetical protein